jgi:hypothetical protein
MQPAPRDNQLMSKHRVLSFKPQLRLEWRGQYGQDETEQPDHSASLGDSITSSTRMRFSVHPGRPIEVTAASWRGCWRRKQSGDLREVKQASSLLAVSQVTQTMSAWGRCCRTVIPLIPGAAITEAAMMGRQISDQPSLFYEFRLEDRTPKDHLLRRINVFWCRCWAVYPIN